MSVNDKIYKGLYNSEGTTINEKIYNYLGSLGYTGSFNDRLSKLEANGKKGWQALLSETPALEVVGSLFSEGQQGAMYIPKPTYLGSQVLYQDAAGTTPVSADGDPVGLMLDVSQGLELGPEELTNTAFSEWTNDDPDGYTVIGTEDSGSFVTQVTEGVRIVSDGDLIGIQGQSLDESKYYKITLTVESLAGAGTIDVGFADSTGNGSNMKRVSSAGAISFIRKPDSATSATPTIKRTFGEDGVDVIVGKWGIKELPGNHASQSTSAARPIYRTDGSLHWLEFDGVGSSLKLFTAYSSDITLLTSAIWEISDSGRFIISEYDSATSLYGMNNYGGSTPPFLFGHGFSESSDPSFANTKRVTGFVSRGVEIHARYQGTTRVINTASRVVEHQGVDIFIGARGGSAFFWKGSLYGVVIADSSGGVDAAASPAEDYLAKLAGTTL